MTRSKLVTASIAALATGPSLAAACPYCETEIGQAVRAEVFNSQFAVNAFATLLPLIVLAAIVAEIRLGLLFPTATTSTHPTADS